MKIILCIKKQWYPNPADTYEVHPFDLRLLGTSICVKYIEAFTFTDNLACEVVQIVADKRSHNFLEFYKTIIKTMS